MGKLRIKSKKPNKRDIKKMLKNSMYAYSELVRLCVAAGFEVIPKNIEMIFRISAEDKTEFMNNIKKYCYDPITNHDVLFGNPEDYATIFEGIAMMLTTKVIPSTYHNNEIMKLNEDEFLNCFINIVNFNELHKLYNTNIGTSLCMQTLAKFNTPEAEDSLRKFKDDMDRIRKGEN